jgi:SAM-dependent methyltransferase
MTKQAARRPSFKFEAETKQPLLWRPTKAAWPAWLLLAALKAIGSLPMLWMRSQLSLDCNERIVEVPFVLQHLPSAAGLRILDFGCTESLVPLWLAHRGATVVGADLREYGFRHPNLTFLKGDFLANGLADASFDAVVALSAVEHAGLNVYGSSVYESGDRRVVHEFLRVLKPGGRLLLTLPCGRPCVTADQRVYSAEETAELVAGFTVETREFYVKAPDGTFWRPCSAEETAAAGCDPVTGCMGVALLACAKPA